MRFYSFVKEAGMDNQFAVRLGAAAGWMSFIGIVAALIVAPMIVTGQQPPTIATDLATVTAYFRHSEMAIIYGFIAPMVGAVSVVVFALGLRHALREGAGERTRTFADMGLALLMVAVPIYLVSGGLAAALVHAADGDAGSFATLFRFYEIVYDGVGDVLEGSWIGAFGVAMLASRLPRWIGWIGIAAGLSRFVKALVPFGVPVEPIILLNGVLFLVWFLATVVSLTLAARRPALLVTPAAAAA